MEKETVASLSQHDEEEGHMSSEGDLDKGNTVADAAVGENAKRNLACLTWRSGLIAALLVLSAAGAATLGVVFGRRVSTDPNPAAFANPAAGPATPAPTDGPVLSLTDAPTADPTDAPMADPTDAPTAAPTDVPTAAPTDWPDFFCEASVIRASDGSSGEQFGRSVAISGDTLAVGATHDDENGERSGSVRVFVRVNSTWEEQAKLLPSDAHDYAYFGYSLAISGDTIVAGKGAWGSSGGAYIFSREGSTWTEQARLIPGTDSETAEVAGVGYEVTVMEGSASGTVSGNLFRCFAVDGKGSSGDCAGASGKVCLIQRGDITFADKVRECEMQGGVGVIIFNNAPALFSGTLGGVSTKIPFVGMSGTDGAAVEGMVGSPATVTTEGNYTFFDGTNEFGASVGIDGDHVVVGDPGDANHNGSAYVFSRALGSSAWEMDSELMPSDGVPARANFGTSVAIHDGTVLVGADSEDGNRGSTYVFVRSGTEWAEQEKLFAKDGAYDDGFGTSVSLLGDMAVVGADGGRGTAYLFARNGSDWTQTDKLVSNGEWYEKGVESFGKSVSISEHAVIIGAYGNSEKCNNCGSSYVFVQKGGTWVQRAQILPNDGEEYDWFGYSASADGTSAVIGTWGATLWGGDSEKAYVYELC